MTSYNIGVLKGDDIGLEVVPAAVEVLKAAAKYFPDLKLKLTELPVGYSSYLELGETLPSSTMETLRELDGWILGPLGHASYPKDAPGAINPHPIIRKEFELHSNIRPIKSHPSIEGLHDNVDLIIVRENNEGFQPDRNVYKGYGEFMPTSDMAISVRVITRDNSRFVAKTAFELANQRNGLKKVTLVHKKSVFKMGCDLFTESCCEIAKEYEGIEVEEINVDTFAMNLLVCPQQYDVVVTTNLFGDILSDEAAGLIGGLGMAPGFCVGPEKAMAQAPHGSAPDIYGDNISNPYAIIISSAMLLTWLGNQNQDDLAVQAGKGIKKATEQTLSGSIENLTPDLGGTGDTSKMTEAIKDNLGSVLS